MNFNEISDISIANSPTSLRTLHLGSNKLTKLDRSFLSLSQLEILFLFDNRIDEIPEWISDLSKLECLRLSNNNLSSLPASLGSLSSLESAARRHPSAYGLYAGDNPFRNELKELAALRQPDATVRILRFLREETAVAEPIGELEIVEASIEPNTPLPTDRAAVRFTVQNGQVDVLPTAAWDGNKDRASRFLDNVRQLISRLQSQLGKTDALANIASAVDNLDNLLSSDISAIDPDLLRIASPAIESKARAYSHPQAEWEVGVAVVDTLIELSTALRDLQALVRNDLEANLDDIRELEIREQGLEETLAQLNELGSFIVEMDRVVTHRTTRVIAVSEHSQKIVEGLADNIQVASERILILENLTTALSRYLSTGAATKPSIADRSLSEEEASASEKSAGKNLLPRVHSIIKKTVSQIEQTLPQNLGMKSRTISLTRTGVEGKVWSCWRLG